MKLQVSLEKESQRKAEVIVTSHGELASGVEEMTLAAGTRLGAYEIEPNPHSRRRR
jgi:hypothetical protein